MELGSEFHIDLTDTHIRSNTIYDLLDKYNTFYTDYGRTAITLLYEFLCEKSGVLNRKVLLPSYICSSVTRPFPQENIVFYDLKENFEMEEQGIYELLESGDFDGGIFFLMHYFGTLQNEETLQQIQNLCKRHGITIIEDATHSLLTKERTIGDYCVASLRKWMPIPEGGVVYSNNSLPERWLELKHTGPSHKIEAMVLKQLFLGQADGYRELENVKLINEEYRRMFVEEEEKIGKDGSLFAISDLSAFLLQCEDIEEIRERRAANYCLLGELLEQNGMELYGWQQNGRSIQSIKEGATVPFTALLSLKDTDRDQFRSYLAEHKIYCAVHWPIETEEQYQYANVSQWSRQLISLPIDQRYTEAHMRYLAETVAEYFRK